MKRLIKILGLVIALMFIGGCVSNDNMENITIYTSGYPIEFVTKKLYGDHGKIYNMYPQGINPSSYKLTKKQITDYGNGNLIIYNGLSKDKDNIVTMLNNNKKLKIIDATSRIEYNDDIDEIWINPSNLLTVAQNVRNGLKEYLTSTIIINEVNKNYEELKVEISTIDADLKEMAENSNDKNLLVSTNRLDFLSKYGLNIYSLDEKSNNEKNLSDIKRLINNGSIKYIFMINDEEETDTIKILKEEFPNLEIIYIDSLTNISTKDKNENKDYISIMNDNIDKLKLELY